jgi:hypothetical protein
MNQLRRILMVEEIRKTSFAALEEYKLANEVIVTRDGKEALDFLLLPGVFHTRPNHYQCAILSPSRVNARNIGYRYSEPCCTSTWGRLIIVDAHRHQTPNARVRMMQTMVATRFDNCMPAALFSNGLLFGAISFGSQTASPKDILVPMLRWFRGIRLSAGVNDTSCAHRAPI